MIYFCTLCVQLTDDSIIEHLSAYSTHPCFTNMKPNTPCNGH